MCSSFADFAHQVILQNTISLEALLPERELRKADEPLKNVTEKTIFSIKTKQILKIDSPKCNSTKYLII